MSKKSFDPVSKFHFRSSLDRRLLPLRVQKKLKEHETELTFKKNEVIYAEGSFPKGIYFIKKGIVKAIQRNEDGSTQIIYFYIPGEIFGYRPLLCQESNPFTTLALEGVTVSFIKAHDFLNILQDSKEFSHQLLFNLSKEFSMWVNRINVFAKRSVRERLALALLILNEKFGGQNGEAVTIRLTKTDLANYIGTSIEVLVRTLKEFEKSGCVSIQGKEIIIKNRLKLYSEAGIC